MVARGQLPPALLFAGSRGTGKTTSGRILAAALNCHSDNPPCTVCASCKAIENGTSLDVTEVDAASNGLVADIRKIKEHVLYASTGDWRIVLLDEAHSMSKEAFNALLKVLEEPPPQTIFILLTTEPGRILDTVVSRSMSFEFRRISIDDIVKRLTHINQVEELGVSHDVLVEIATRAQGGMRDAIMVLDQISYSSTKDINSFRDFFGIVDVAIPILAAASEGDIATGCDIIEEHFHRTGDAGSLVSDLTVLVRNLLVEKAGGTPPPTDDVTSAARSQLAARCSTESLIAVAKVLWDLKNRTRHTENDQLASMHLAMVLVTDAISSPITRSAVQAAPASKMSLTAMKEMVI